MKYLNDPVFTVSRVADAPEPFVTFSVPPSWNVPELVVMYKNVLSLAT